MKKKIPGPGAYNFFT